MEEARHGEARYGEARHGVTSSPLRFWGCKYDLPESSTSRSTKCLRDDDFGDAMSGNEEEEGSIMFARQKEVLDLTKLDWLLP